MDKLRGQDDIAHDDAYDYEIDEPQAVFTNERRLHVRAYNHWASLLGERALPSIEDLNPSQLEDFGPYSVLLDFSMGVENPAIIYLGSALREECGVSGTIERIDDVPPRSLLTRLTDHYLQIIANSAPVGFEAEFTNQRDVQIMYRGILMPFSSDGVTIDFIYGVISWKEIASNAVSEALNAEIENALKIAAPPAASSPIWADAPLNQADDFGFDEAAEEDMPLELDAFLDQQDDMPENDELDLGAFAIETEEEASASSAPAADQDLDATLDAARQYAIEARESDVRSRTALYRAIGHAYDFALAARLHPADYENLLKRSGIIVQERSPMTAVIKLVFGADYDKTRIAEYAMALEYALSQDLPRGSLARQLAFYQGGLKGLIHDMRDSRRDGETLRPNRRIERARLRLSKAKSIAVADLHVDAEGLTVAVVRREADGTLTVLAALDTEEKAAQKVMIEATRRHKAKADAA